jgi:6-pyruvoyltetrahydropterin/6-carboxytetrahydropterin synthase
MKRVRITKEFSFEMAHALHRYDGKCENIHGHTYHLSVTVIGSPGMSAENSKQGMVIDFSDLKRIVQEQILNLFDHAMVMNGDDPRRKALEDVACKLILTPYQPTSENLILDFVNRLLLVIPDEVTLHSVLLRETDSSYAEWYASDN